MISVLFVSKKSVYKGLGVDCWDIERDARLWPGGNAGIFHPPCRLWSMLRRFSNAPASEKELGLWAIEQVRRWGGVLEQPGFSKLWEAGGLPRPGKRDEWGFSLGVEQHWFGHPSRKRTWLYIVGVEPKEVPIIPLRMALYRPVFSGHGRKEPALRREYREGTPIEFARWLVETAELCNKRVYAN